MVYLGDILKRNKAYKDWNIEKRFFMDKAKAQRRCWLCDRVIDIGEECMTVYIENSFNGYTKVNLHLHHLKMNTIKKGKESSRDYLPI